MNASQKTVAIGAAIGVATMIVLVAVLSTLLPEPEGLAEIPARIVFALRLNVIAVLPFFAMLVAIGNSRFLSDAINPLAQKERADQQINGRVADNTLQQNFVFLVATLALSTVLPPAYLQVLVAMTIVFILARIAFWIGYRIDPLYRAPGMSATAYLNLGGLLTAIYFALRT